MRCLPCRRSRVRVPSAASKGSHLRAFCVWGSKPFLTLPCWGDGMAVWFMAAETLYGRAARTPNLRGSLVAPILPAPGSCPVARHDERPKGGHKVRRTTRVAMLRVRSGTRSRRRGFPQLTRQRPVSASWIAAPNAAQVCSGVSPRRRCLLSPHLNSCFGSGVAPLASSS